jgi:hypothetical protein
MVGSCVPSGGHVRDAGETYRLHGTGALTLDAGDT